MKKRLFSFLAAIALVVSIGGVYASWTYAQGTVGDTQANTKLALTAVSTSSDKGTIALSNNQFTIQIDQIASGDEGYGTVDPHTAVMRVTGAMTVTFTPSDNAEKSVKEDGVVLALTITESYGNYTDSVNSSETDLDIITLKPSDIGTGVYLLNNGQPVNGTYTLDNDTLNSYLVLAALKLESKAEYDDFNTNFLTGKTITFTISEYVPTT